MSDKSVFLAALNKMLPPGIGAGWADPWVEHPLMPGEVLPNATAGRMREFTAGRAAARAAFADIGLPPAPIPHGPGRAPIWPPGVLGSITHTATNCLAVAAPEDRVQGIGIDLEPASPLAQDLWDIILTPAEMVNLEMLPPDQRGLSAKAAFCIKEAAYKAQFPISRTLFGFDVLHVTQNGDRFTATFTTPIAPFKKGDRILGKIARFSAHVLAFATL